MLMAHATIPAEIIRGYKLCKSFVRVNLDLLSSERSNFTHRLRRRAPEVGDRSRGGRATCAVCLCTFDVSFGAYGCDDGLGSEVMCCYYWLDVVGFADATVAADWRPPRRRRPMDTVLSFGCCCCGCCAPTHRCAAGARLCCLPLPVLRRRRWLAAERSGAKNEAHLWGPFCRSKQCTCCTDCYCTVADCCYAYLALCPI